MMHLLLFDVDDSFQSIIRHIFLISIYITAISVLAIREENQSNASKEKAATEKRTSDLFADSLGESKSVEGADRDDSVSTEEIIPETRV